MQGSHVLTMVNAKATVFPLNAHPSHRAYVSRYQAYLAVAQSIWYKEELSQNRVFDLSGELQYDVTASDADYHG